MEQREQKETLYLYPGFKRPCRFRPSGSCGCQQRANRLMSTYTSREQTSSRTGTLSHQSPRFGRPEFCHPNHRSGLIWSPEKSPSKFETEMNEQQPHTTISLLSSHILSDRSDTADVSCFLDSNVMCPGEKGLAESSEEFFSPVSQVFSVMASGKFYRNQLIFPGRTYEIGRIPPIQRGHKRC